MRFTLTPLLSSVAFVVATMPVATAEDWPQFRGPGGLGISSELGLPAEWNEQKNITWKSELPGAGSSGPIVVGPRIFLGCYSGFQVPRKAEGRIEDLKLHAVCLDRATGTVKWDVKIAPRLPEQEKIREGHGYASGTPACDGERVYFCFGKTGLFAFDLDGRKLWQADIGDGLNGWGSCPSPVVVGELVVVNASVESESLIAFERATGKEVWRARGIKESWNTPVLVPAEGGRTELVVAILGRVLGFDPASGKQLWTCGTDISWYMVPSLSAKDGIVYCIGGRSGGGLAVKVGGRGDVTATHRTWTGKKGSNVTSPVLHDGHLYWMHENNGVAYCADAATGRIVYEERVPGADQVYASAVLGDGKIYYVSRRGRTIVVSAKPTFEKIAVNDLGERDTFNATPAIAGGRLFLRSDRFLYCIGTK